MELSHLDKKGQARMVDVGAKKVMRREAVASGSICLEKSTLDLIEKGLIQKGDVLAVARVAGIQAAKKTPDLIPLCHPLPVSSVDLSFSPGNNRIVIRARAVCEYKTGIEMEALTAVSMAALTIYDMCKSVDENMRITDITLEQKTKNDL